MKLLTSILSTIFIATLVIGQEQPAEAPKYGWKKEMVGGIALAQTSFDNWAQGGENSSAWQANLNFKFENDQSKSNWANSGKLSYGNSKTGSQEARKSIDEIRLESVLTYKLGVLINPYLGVTGETQFAPGYSYETNPKTQLSAFIDPAYLRASAGVGFKPNEMIKTRLGAAIKYTITGDFPKPYADDPATKEIEKTKTEPGAESVTDLDWKMSDTSKLTSKLELFSNLKGFDAIDVNWDNMLATKVTQLISVNLNVKLFYDQDISAKRQLKQALTIGLSYNFF